MYKVLIVDDEPNLSMFLCAQMFFKRLFHRKDFDPEDFFIDLRVKM